MSQKKLLVLTGFLMVAIAGWLYHDQLSVFDAGKRIEAEWGLIEGPMRVVQDGNLSGGSYIKSSKEPDVNNRGTATYRFRVDEHGVYKIKAKAYGYAGHGDSFFIIIDDQPEITWDLKSRNRRWGSEVVTKRRNPQSTRTGYMAEIELTSGTHTLIVKEREQDSGLDYVEFEMIRPVVAASFLSGFHLSQFVQGALALSLVALSLVAIRLSRNIGPSKRRTAPSIDMRLNALDKRISDMQEIMISLDEQLKRQKKQSAELVDTV